MEECSFQKLTAFTKIQLKIHLSVEGEEGRGVCSRLNLSSLKTSKIEKMYFTRPFLWSSLREMQNKAKLTFLLSTTPVLIIRWFSTNWCLYERNNGNNQYFSTDYFKGASGSKKSYILPAEAPVGWWFLLSRQSNKIVFLTTTWNLVVRLSNWHEPKILSPVYRLFTQVFMVTPLPVGIKATSWPLVCDMWLVSLSKYWD